MVPKNLLPSVIPLLPVVDQANPLAGEASVLMTYAVVASCVELLFVAGVVPVEILLSAAAPVTVSVPPMDVLPPILVAPLIPVPPVTMSAPLFIAVEAVALEMVVMPEILVVASVEVFCTVKLLNVFVAVPAAVIPLLKVASPRILPEPVIS